MKGKGILESIMAAAMLPHLRGDDQHFSHGGGRSPKPKRNPLAITVPGPWEAHPPQDGAAEPLRFDAAPRKVLPGRFTIHVNDRGTLSPGIRVHHHLYHNLPLAYGTFRTVSSEEMDAGRFKARQTHVLDLEGMPHSGLLEAPIFTCSPSVIPGRPQGRSGEAEDLDDMR